MENFNIEQYNIIDHLEVGSPVFDWMLQEWLDVDEIDLYSDYPIETRKSSYTNNGLCSVGDKFPRLTIEEWHPFSGKPFPKLPEKKVLEVFVLKHKVFKNVYHVIGEYVELHKSVYMIVNNERLAVYKLEVFEIIERTTYTGTYLK